MSLNYAEKFESDILDILIQDSLISPFITTNVKWLDAKTFHFTQMSTSGYKNHNRAGGWNSGTYTQQDVPFTVTHDRDIQFLVDKADVDETNQTASIKNISLVFEKTQATPEANALFFSKIAAAAQATTTYKSSTASNSFTKANVFGKLKDMLATGKLRRYRQRGSLIMYVTSDIMDKLEQSTDFTRKIEMTQIADGGIGIETRVTDIDGVPVMEVIDDEVFYDKFKFDGDNGGYEPAVGGHKINVLIASAETCKYVPKIASIYFFNPGDHTEGDGYLYQNRALSDAFVFPNGKDKQIDSIYVDTDTTAITAA